MNVYFFYPILLLSISTTKYAVSNNSLEKPVSESLGASQ